MIAYIYRPKRLHNGRRTTSRLYSAKIRVAGEQRISQVSLHVSDKQVAQEKLRQLVQEREKELHGLLPPRTVRDASQEPLSKHLKDFISDLRALGRNHQYIAEFENRLELLMDQCRWQFPQDVTADSLTRWRSQQQKAAKTMNEYLASAKGFLNWMMKQGRIAVNPLAVVQKTETRGKEVRARRAYSDAETQALLNVAGKRRIVYLMAVLTGIRHGELKALCWSDVNLSAEKPSVTVRASISKNHKLACLPLHPDLATELLRFRPAKAKASDLVFDGLMPHSVSFNADLKAAGILKTDSQGRVVDFHSLRHTFCTNLHRAGVPQREAMELMRHNDPRLTANTYADASLFSLRGAVEKLSLPSMIGDAQIDAQSLGAGRLLPSLPVTVGNGSASGETPVNTGQKSLDGTLCHEGARTDDWCPRQDLNLYDVTH